MILPDTSNASLAITQGKRRKNARKSDILSGSPYRKLVTDKVGAESATGKKRSWKKSSSRIDQYRAGPLPVGDEAQNPCHVRPPTTYVTARCVEKTTATHPLMTGSSAMNARHGGTKNAPITVPLDLSCVTIARRDFTIGLSYL